MAKKKKNDIIGWVDEKGNVSDTQPITKTTVKGGTDIIGYVDQNGKTSDTMPYENKIRSVQSTVDGLNNFNKQYKTENTITDSNGNVTVKMPKVEEKKKKVLTTENTTIDENGNVNLTKNVIVKPKTVEEAKAERDIAYNKLNDYKKEKGINLFNENKFKKDEEYQDLLRQVQNTQKDYDNARVEKNAQKTKKELEDNKNIGGSVAKFGIGLASGVTRGIGGIESTARKLTGQTNDEDRTKYEIFEPMLNAAYETANKPERIAMNIGQSWGQMVPQMLTGNPTSAMGVGFANYGGSAYNEAKKSGATEQQATTYGLLSGGTEMLMEKALGGFENIYGKSALGKSSNEFLNNVMNKFVKSEALKRTLSGARGEFTEEYLQEFLEPILKNIILKEKNGADFWNASNLSEGIKQLSHQFFNMQNLEAGLQGGLSSGLLQGPMNFSLQNQANKYGLTIDQYVNAVQNNQIPIQPQENTLQDYQNELINQINQEQPQIPTQTPLNALNQGVREQNVEIPYQTETPQITPLNQVNQELQETRQQDVADSVKAMNLEQEPQFTQKQGNYVYEKSDNSKIDNLRKDAANYLKEGEQTTNFVNTLEKLVKDKDIEIRFDTKLGNNVNGTYKNGVITINPNSNRAGEFVAIHELTHAIGTKPMIDMIQTYRKSNAEFNQAVERILSTYNTTEINEEALGDIAGQLFGNQEYINNLSMENPSLFKKIYNEIKYLWHQFTGYKNQDQFIEDLRNKWESAYRNQKVQQKAKNSNIEMSNQTDSNGNMLSNEQVDYFKDSKVRDKNGDLLIMNHATSNNSFTIFDENKQGTNSSNFKQKGELGRGFYFSDEQTAYTTWNDYVERQTGKPVKGMSVYLKINNPFYYSTSELNKDVKNYLKDKDAIMSRIKSNADIIKFANFTDLDIQNMLKELGYDGIIERDDNNIYQAVVFNSNQIKNIDNLTPTKNNDIRYSKNEEISTRDNTGRELSKQQQEYFKDSKARDENGNLIELYHGTPNDFTKFNYDKLGTNGTLLGKGFYLTDDINVGEAYANKSDNGKIMKLYADIQKPLKWGEKSISKSQYKDFVEAINEETNGTLFADYSGEYSEKGSNQYNSTLNDILMDYEYGGDDIDLISGLLNSTGMSWEKAYRILKDVTGYDGIIVTKDVYDSGEGNVYIPFLPEQIKNVDNLNPTEDPDIRYSKDNQTWREYLEKEFPSKGTRTDLGEVTGRKQQKTTKPATETKTTQEQPKKVVKQNYLTKAEQEELETLKELDNKGFLEETDKDYKRLQELEKKQQGIVKKFPELKKENTFDDIKGIYGKYKNNEISKSNKEILNKAKSFIEPNSQGRRTIEQWKSIAEFIGSNADIKNSQELQRLAIETWHEQKPNSKEQLNRQGKGFVKFGVDDWVNAVYKGAGVGTDVKMSIEENTINENKQEDKITITSKDIVNSLNNAKKGKVPDGKKMRSWVETSNASTFMEKSIEQADIDAITYEVQSNRKTYEQAVSNTKNLSYEQKVFNAQNKLNTNKKVSLTDLAEAQLALREAATKGDTKTYLNLQQDIAIMGTELGQMIQSLSMIKKLSPDGQLMMLQKIVDRQQKLGNKNWDGVEFDEKLIQKVLDSYDDASHTTFNQEKLDNAINDLKQNLADQMKVSKAEKINEWRYLSMLGNPKTHIRNIVANVAMTTTKRVKETLNAGMQDLLISKSENKTATLKKSSQEVKDLSKIAYEETFEVNKGNKYNEKSEIESKRKIFNNKIIEGFRELNAKALDLEDQAFKKIEFERAFSNYLTAQNIKTTEDINTHPEIVQQAKAFALEESKIATFQQENEFANWINKLDKKGPVAKVVRGAVIPFTRTPLNIAKTGLEYAPGTGLLTTIADVKKAPENMKGNVAINGIAKQITGTSLALVGYALAKGGLLNSGDDDDKEGKFKKDQGMSMGFSIKLGNKSYDLSWLSPSSMPLFVGASMYEQLEKSDGFDGNVVMEGIANTLDPLSEMSCISSFTQVLQSFQKGSSKMISQMAQKTTQNYISQFVPTISSQFARLFDTKKRTTNADKTSGFTFGQETQRQLMYKIPGLRNLLPEQTDFFGETKKEEENILIRGIEAFLSPANTKKETAGKEAKELLKIYNKTGEDRVIPSSLNKTMKYDGENVKMTNKEWNSYKKDFGTTLKETMQELMNSKEYKNASDMEKAAILKDVMTYSKDKAKDNFLDSKGKEWIYTSDKADEKRKDYYSVAEYYIIKNQADKIFNGDVDTVRKRIENADNLNMSVVDYYNLKKELNTIKADKNSNGKSVSGSKKQKVVDYINSLDELTEEQKYGVLSSMYKKW